MTEIKIKDETLEDIRTKAKECAEKLFRKEMREIMWRVLGDSGVEGVDSLLRLSFMKGVGEGIAALGRELRENDK